MEPSYDILFRFGRYFLARHREFGTLFWARSDYGSYTILWGRG